MKKVMQTAFGKGKGNCLLACVASILERPLESIPDFNLSGVGWFDELYEWCLTEGIGLLYLNPGDLKCLLVNTPVILGYEVVGYDPASECHAVVGKAFLDESSQARSWEGWLWRTDEVHDPNPNYKRLGSLLWVLVLIPGSPVREEVKP